MLPTVPTAQPSVGLIIKIESSVTEAGSGVEKIVQLPPK
jgi:hypothetical protein